MWTGSKLRAAAWLALGFVLWATLAAADGLSGGIGTSFGGGISGRTGVGALTVPGGATTQVQFNNAGAFAGDSGFTYAGAGGAVAITGPLASGALTASAATVTALAGSGSRCVQASATGVLSATAGACAAGGTPGGATTQLQFNSGGAFAGDSGLTYAGAGGVLTLTPAANTAQPMLITGGSVTGAGTGKLGLSIVGTINTTGVVDGSVLFANVTNTASAVGSPFVDIQVAGASVFSIVGRAQSFLVPGSVIVGTASGLTGIIIGAGTTGPWLYNDGANNFLVGAGTTARQSLKESGTFPSVVVGNGDGYAWSSSASPAAGVDTATSRLAAGVVAVGNGTISDATGAIEARSHIVTGATPTYTGTCTAPSAKTGGNTAGTFTVSASGACAAGTYIQTFAFTAPNGWACAAWDQTTTTNTVKQTASTTTTATYSATTANNDVVGFHCLGF